MSDDLSQPKTTSFSFSLDAWAVILGLVLAALVRLGVLRHVPW